MINLRLSPSLIIISLIAIYISSCKSSGESGIFTITQNGDQPSADIDSDGILGIAYGSGDDILFTYSVDQGSTFSSPELVGTLDGLVLGMSSGPRLSLSKEYYTIMAPRKNGDLLSWRKKRGGNMWDGPYVVNDVPGSAGEYLADISSDDKGSLYAVWIDTRRTEMKHGEMQSGQSESHGQSNESKEKENAEVSQNIPKQLTKEEIMEEIGEMPEGAESIRQYPGGDGQMYWVVLDVDGNAIKAKNMENYLAFKAQNGNRPKPQAKIYLSKSSDGGNTWNKSKMIYFSPDGSICECCMPSVETDIAGNVYIMFRNNLNGARDLYLTKSLDKGMTFDQPQKLGMGTWLLNGCPMDGGGFHVNSTSKAATVWQREGEIYFAVAGEEESLIGTGRSPSIGPGLDGYYITWNEHEDVMVRIPQNSRTFKVGDGSHPQIVSSENGENVFAMWIDEGMIKIKKLSE